ncbi:MAG: esterase family protein, partial [Chloroflexi bacterium]|nr:esterase family protein [Chloroflexota bacterium]
VLTSTPTLPPTIPPIPSATPAPTLTPTQPPTPSPTPCAGSGWVETAVFPSHAGPIAYRIYLPPCYGENGRAYPTLYMLPGNNQTDAIWDDLGLDETAESAIQNKEIPPLLIVMPDGGWIARNSSGGPHSYETVIFDDLIPFIEANYCAWPDTAGRAIGGLSRGGYWALEIAFRHPGRFVSVGGHSASLLDIAAGPDINPQYTALTNNLGDLRIYLDIGENDGGIPNTRRLHKDMTARGVPHAWALNPGGHDNAYWAAHLAEYLAWYAVPWSLDASRYPVCPPNQ